MLKMCSWRKLATNMDQKSLRNQDIAFAMWIWIESNFIISNFGRKNNFKSRKI